MSEVKRVCVTGAGGFLASWLVKFLLAKGYMVHGTVRDPSDNKNSHLKQLEKATDCLKLFKADLFDYQGLFAAIEGCHGVFHVASPLPFPFDVSQCRKEDITEPAVEGTCNVINASSKAKVNKVVVVSSVGAVGFNPHWPQGQIMDEECWSDIEFCEANKFWYFLSKTAAEKEAWELSKGNEMIKVVTVCPSIVIGPLLQPTRNSSNLYLLTFFQDDGDGAASNGSRAFVDVRDTAESLLLVYENPEAEGRYICSSYHTMTPDFVNMLQKMYPHYAYPKRFNEEETLISMEFSSKKLQDLGWRYRPFEETIMDTVKSYQEIGAKGARRRGRTIFCDGGRAPVDHRSPSKEKRVVAQGRNENRERKPRNRGRNGRIEITRV